MATETHTNGTQSGHVEELDALVVGAGFGGVYSLYHLRKLGLKVKLFEAASGLGGTWRCNSYPGARVDSDVPIYQFFAEELWRDWTWTERFPDWTELRKYFAYVDSKWDVSRDIRFDTRVVSASFDASTDKWTITTADGTAVRARFFVCCTGFASKPYTPAFKGLDTFKGICHHTGLWPKEGVECAGKRVAVIGTGASGVQVIQEIGPQVEHLTVYQRTPNLTLPMQQRKLDAASQEKEKPGYPKIFSHLKETFAGFTGTFLDKSALEVTPEERTQLYEELFEEGGFAFWLSTYRDVLWDKKANDTAYDFWVQKTRERINDPAKANILAPLRAPHAFGTKRPCLEQRYYEVYNQPNVDIIDVRKTPIEEITPKGVKTADGKEVEVDILILATGFDAVTGGLTQIDIRGIDGQLLRDKWRDGTDTYLGLTSAGFPNFFFLYGPHGPTAFCNGPTCVDVQGSWIVSCIENMMKNNLTRIDANDDAQAEWKNDLDRMTNASLFVNTDSWYMGANIPGKKREGLNYLGGLPKYIEQCQEVVEKGYKGFKLSTVD